MKSRIRVYIHTASWHISRSNTDYKLREKLASLSNRFSECEFYLPKEFLSGLDFNVKYVFDYLKRKLRKKSTAQIKEFEIDSPEYRKFNPDVIISQGHFPNLHKNDKTPVIWEIYFINPKTSNYGDQEFKDNYWFREMLPQYKLHAEKATIIGVRDNYSLNFFRKLIPSQSEKVRILPFYLPDLEYVEQKSVVKKQSNNDIIRIIFVGSQAVRKDLASLIEAFELLTTRYKNKLELVIISKMTDGKVAIPNKENIKYYEGLPYDETLQLLKSSHIYAMTSLTETFGISYLEAMANGCAVVARNFYPQKEIFTQDSAVFIPPKSPELLADALYNLCMYPQYRLEIACKGLDLFKSKYHWKQVGQVWNDTIQDIVIKKNV